VQRWYESSFVLHVALSYSPLTTNKNAAIKQHEHAHLNFLSLDGARARNDYSNILRKMLIPINFLWPNLNETSTVCSLLRGSHIVLNICGDTIGR
jgi:hypothetical protein